MSTHDELRQSLDNLSNFRHWARYAIHEGDGDLFIEGMKAGKGRDYESARKGLLGVLSELRDADAIELLFKVTRMLPEFKNYTADPACPFLTERVHYEDFSASARDALLYWDALRALALRLEAVAMVANTYETERGWTWEELRARLMEIPGMKSNTAGNWKKRGGLIEAAPGVYTVASCEAVLERASKPRKRRDASEEYDPLDV